jgi:filamentous hemagglutinin family protein
MALKKRPWVFRDVSVMDYQCYPIIKSYVKQLVGLMAGSLFSFASVFANPTGGQVTAGSATISSPTPTTVEVNQTTDKAVIDWRSFNISPNEHTHFQQPSRSSITLNRIDPTNGGSHINGQLTANGQIWLINPAGIMFGSNAVVDVAGLVATTANITNKDFMEGNYHFVQSPDWHGAIINNGKIIARGGAVALYAPAVENNGLIKADLNKVVLASGTEYTLDFLGDQLIQFSVDQPIVDQATDQEGNPIKTRVSNTGKIISRGGSVIMTVKTAKGVLDKSINMSGYVEAKSVSQKNGEIVLMGGENGSVTVSGKMIASGKNKGEKGGKITVVGKSIEITNKARINVSGDIGAGEVLIGGDYQGKNPNVLNATNTYVANGAKIFANALTSGNGGKVIVFSDNDTSFFGDISSRGGAISGNGGFVEVSGKENLLFDGAVNTTAANGQVGTLLLDPKFLIIQTSGGSAYNNGVNNLFANNASGTNTLTPASIVAAAATNNIILQANTDVTFSTALTITGAGTSGRTLTVQAGRNININANITTNNGAVSMTANDTSADVSNRDAGAGGITMASGTTLSAGTSTINLFIDPTATGGFTPGDMTLRGLTGSTITVSTPGAITLNGIVTASSGTLSLTSGGAITQAAVALTGNSLIAKTLNDSGSAITLNNSTNNFVNVDLRARNAADTSNAAGAIDYRDTNAVTVAAANTASTVTLTAGGVLDQSGSMTGTTLTASTRINGGAAINFTNAGNEFSSIDIRSRNTGNTANAAGAISYTDATGFDINSSVATTSTVDLIAGGAITQASGAGTGIFGTTLTAKTLNNSGSAITLANSLNSLTTVDLRTRNAADTTNVAGAIAYTDTNAVAVAAANTTSTVNLIAGGAITQTGSMTGTTLTAKTLLNGGAAITLDISGGNEFSSIDLRARNAVDTANVAGAISYRDTTGFNIADSIATTSTVTLTAGDAITQNSGAGTGIFGTTLTAKTLNDSGAAINLNNSLNALTTVNLQARNAADTTNAAGAINYIDADGVAISGINTASTLDLTTGGSITQSGALTISGLPTFTVSAAASDILLATSANAFSTTPVFTNNGNIRDLSLRNTSASAVVPTLPTGLRNLALIFDSAAMILPAMTLSGTLTATASGAITQLGALSGTTLTAKTLNDSGSAITLGNTFSNEFTTVNLQARNAADSADSAGAIIYKDATGFDVSGLRTTNTAALTSGGAMTDSGALVIGGIATFNSGTSNITFNTATNDFGTVVVSNSNNTTLVDVNALEMGASTIGGTLSLTTGGAITQSGALNVTGNTTLVAGAGNNITLDNVNNDFSNVATTSGNNVVITDTNAIVLGTSGSIATPLGSLNVTAGGNITQNGVLRVTGTPTFTLTAPSSSISLASQANDFATTPVITNNANILDILLRNTNTSAAVPILPTLSTVRDLTLTYNNATSLVLPAITISRSLSVTTNGPITQTGILTVPTTATFNSTSNDITLDTFANDFGTTVITTGNNVKLNDANSLILGASTVSGTFDVTTHGALTQSGAQTISGLMTINANSNNVTLATSTNNFNTVKVLNGANVSLRDAGSIILDDINASGTLTLQIGGTGNAITQASGKSIIAAGTTTVIATANNDVTLANTGNDFSTIAITSGNNVDLHDANSLILGTSTISGALSVTAAGSISQSGILSVTGIPTFTVSTASSDILLDTQANVFSVTPLFTNNGNIRDLGLRNTSVSAVLPTIPSGLRNLSFIYNNAAINMPATSVTGTLSLTSGVGITQLGALTGADITAKTVNNTGADILLTNSNNNFSTVDLRARNAADSANAAGALSYTDVNGFDVAAANTTSTINLIAGDAITQSGSMAGSTLTAKTLKNTGAAITLNNSANALTSIDLSSRNALDTANTAGAISYRDSNQIDIAHIGTTAAVSIIAGNVITQSGALTGSNLTVKTLNNTGSSASITLNSFANEFNTIDLRARNAADTANSGGVIQYQDATGFDVATIGTSSTINLAAGGAITDSGNMTGTTLTTTSVGGITLDVGDNLTGFNATNTSSGNISLINTGNLSITGVTQSGDGSFILDNTGTTTIAGTVNVGAGNINITSTGAVADSAGAGILAFALIIKTKSNAGSAITLNNVGLHNAATIDLRARNAADAANAAGAITYTDIDEFDVAAIDTTSTVALTGSNALTQSGSMTGSTLTAFTLNDSGANITFNDSNNSFTNINLQTRNAANSADTSGNIAYTNVGTINITGLRTLGDVTILSGGSITDSGSSIIGGILNTTSATGTTLNSANQINGVNATNSSNTAISFSNNSVPLIIYGLSQAGGTVTFSNTGDITIANGASFNTNGGATSLTTSGVFSIGNGTTLLSGDANITLSAQDFNLNSTGAINSGAGTVAITQNVATNSIGLGNTAGDMTISGNELQRITAANLTLNAPSNGQIIVDGISAANSANISGTVTLTATTGTLGSILFQNNASAFRALTATSDEGTTIATNVSTTVGAASLNSNNLLNLNADVSSAGALTLRGTTSGIVLGNSINLTGAGITFNGLLDGAYNLTLDAGSSSNITFQNNVGSSTRLGILTINNMQNLINNGVINVASYTQNAGSLAGFGTEGLDATNTAYVVGNDVTGKVNVKNLTLNTNFANLTGFVNGLSGINAIAIITNLNQITAGTHFFDGIDMYSPVPPPPPPVPPTPNNNNIAFVPQATFPGFYFPSNTQTPVSGDSDSLNPTVHTQEIGTSKQTQSARSCVSVGVNIDVCS